MKLKLLLYKIVATTSICEKIKNDIFYDKIENPYSFIKIYNDCYIVQPLIDDHLSLNTNVIINYPYSRPVVLFTESIDIQEGTDEDYRNIFPPIYTYSSEKFKNSIKELVIEKEYSDVFHNNLCHYFNIKYKSLKREN